MATATCSFREAWIGQCQQPPTKDGCCDKHADQVCVSCGAKATHTCAETMGLVCGALLCDECDHETAPDGTNGGCMKHCRKVDQKHQPWFMQPEQSR